MKTYTSVLFTPLFFLLCPILLHAQNVGIGELNPDYKLHITNTNSSILKLDNSTALANFVSSDLYFKTGIYYTGAIKTLGTGTNVARLGFFTFASSLSSNLLERLSITDAGLVGIGNNNPLDAGIVVDKKIGAVNAMFGRNTTGVAIESNYPGIGLNSYYNGSRKTIATGYTGLISFDPVVGNLILYNSNVSTATDAVATLNSRLFIDKDGEIGIEGNTTPFAPLCLANIVGSKISLYGSVETSNYGFGVQSNLMQVYSAAVSADIAFGYGGSTSFTENMRIKGNGNVGIGNTAPNAPLGFENITGNKIDLFYNSSTSRYGFGVQAGLMQIYSNGSGADIAFGYGSSTSFTERMRIKGTGNVGIGNTDAAFPLDISGRMRLRNVGGTGPGIWFNKPDNTQGTFIGQYDTNNFGIWGPGAAGTWKFLFDGNDGTVRIGTLQKATGYLVNIGGKLIAEEVRVQLQASWPDYVFHPDYALMPLDHLEKYIGENHHLPGFDEAAKMESEGADLGETQRRLMEKVEELTLYVIELKKEIDQLKKN